MDVEHRGQPPDESLVNDPTKAIVALAESLANSLRRSLQIAEASGSSHLLLNSDHDEKIRALVYVRVNEQHPISNPAIRALRALVHLMEKSERFIWFDTLGPGVALELATRRNGTWIDHLYANLNHHRLVFREIAFYVAWLARNRLTPVRAAERILFNVGASHLSANQGLAVLRGMCEDDRDFWWHIAASRPDFANAERYGWGLDTPWPKRREAVLAETLVKLRDPESELARYVQNPHDLWEVERRAALTSTVAASEFATQLAL